MAKQIIEFGDFKIGQTSPIFFIAEIGLNHNGNLQIAKKLIDAAFACNWQCVKFQKRTPDICVPEHQKKIMRDTPWGRMTYLDYRHRLEFGAKEYDYINGYCSEKPILWTASIWDKESLAFIGSRNVAFIKIPSACLTDLELLSDACSYGKPLVISTGMSTVEEIDAAVNVLEQKSKEGYVIMHTNSTYPTPPEDINLNVIGFLRQRYNCIVGYSGHELDLEPSVIAVALGARLIERHITLDHKMWGSDHAASLEVHAMNMLYKRIADIPVIMGNGIKRITAKEMDVRNKLRCK